MTPKEARYLLEVRYASIAFDREIDSEDCARKRA
jgi:hypothetical protein